MPNPDGAFERWLEGQPRDVQWRWALVSLATVVGLGLIVLVVALCWLR